MSTGGGVDLHVHSTRSDGTTSPTETVALAAAAGLAGMALTDHDTVDGWEEAAAACRRHALTFVPGIELSTELEDRSVHLLGYWVDPGSAALVEECRRLRGERERRARAMVSRLRGLGIALDYAAVAALAGDAPVGRPHVAAALVAAGVVPDLDAAFDDYLADGGPAYVPKRALAPVDGVRLIVEAGGAAVLAHPGSGASQAPVTPALVDALAAAGLAGIEADHAGHDEDTAALWRAEAAARDLVVTGASDFHGQRKGVSIGACTTAAPIVRRLRERADASAV